MLMMGKYKILFILVALLLLTRVGALLFFIDKLYMSEELHHGTIAKEIMEGTKLSLFEYPPSNYGQGGLWSGILTIPFFALFGKNRFALQLTPVAFSAVILILLFLFAYKFFNRRVAIITGLLYIFSAPMWVVFNLHNGGLHFENTVFTVAAMYIFYEIIFNGKSNPIYYLSLGLISGFGTYWVYTFLVTPAAISLLWFLWDKKFFLKKGFYIFLAGFFIGMIPWLYYNIPSEFGSIGVFFGFFEQGNYLNLKTWVDTIQRFLKLICFYNMLSFHNQDNLFGKLYFVIYWLSFIYILRRYKFSLSKVVSSKESFLVVFPVLLVVIAAFIGMDLGCGRSYLAWRYFVSLFPIIFLTVAIALDRLFSKVNLLKTISIVIFSILVMLEAIIYSMKINLKDFGSGFKQVGYSYIYLNESFHEKYQRNLYKILDNTTKLSIPQRYEVLTETLAINLIGKIYPVVDFKEYLKLSLRLDEKYRPIFYKILIKGLYYTSDLPLNDLVHEVDMLSKQVDDKYKPYLYEGIGALTVKRDGLDTAKYKDTARLIDEKYLPYYYHGLGEYGYSEDIGDYINRFKNCMGWFDKQYQPLYLEGIGEVLAKLGYSCIVERGPPGEESVKVLYDFINNLEPGYKKYVLEGIGKGLSYFYSLNNQKEVYQFIDNFKGEDREIILKTMIDSLR